VWATIIECGIQVTDKEKEMFEEAATALRETSGLDANLEEGERLPRLSTGWRPDAVVRLSQEKKTFRFYTEIKERLTTSALGDLAAKLQGIRGRTLLVASYINPVQADKLRTFNIPFFDAAGNAFFNEPGLFVFVSGKRPANDLAVRPLRAFRSTGLKVIFALLAVPQLEARTHREIATDSGVSLGAVNWLMQDLTRLGYLREMKTGERKLVNKEDLLRRFVAAYPEQLRPKLLVGRFSATRQDVDWWKRADLTPFGACWGGEVGAALLTKYLKPQAATIYAEGNTTRLQARFGLRRDPTGEVEILRKFWKLPDIVPMEQVAPALLIYADLVASMDDRNIETAELVYERYIARLVGEAAA